MTVAKKATPAKGAPRKVAAPAAEQVPADERKTIVFQKRTIAVRLPTPDQLVAFRRVFARLESARATEMDGERALALLERAAKVVDTVIADEVDRDWLDDQRLEGAATTEDIMPIIINAISAYGDEAPGVAPNRAARRRKA